MKRVTVGSTLATLIAACLVVIFFTGKRCNVCFSAEVMMIKFFISGMIIFIGSIYFTRLYLKNEKIIFNIETLPLLETNEAASDVPFSCEGIVTPIGKETLISPYTKTPCVYYHSITERASGSGRSTDWKITENLIKFIPFYITDDRGKLKVDLTNIDNDFSSYKLIKNTQIPDPDYSEIDCRPTTIREEHTEDRKSLGFLVVKTRFRRTEYILMPSTKVFAHGFVSRINNELVLHEAKNHPLLISEKSKDTYVNEFYKGGNLIFLVHFLLSIGFTTSILAMDYFLHIPLRILLTSLAIGNAGITSSILFTMYNRIILLHQRATIAVSNIEVELKRRAELIPRIAQLVKEYSTHEKNIQEHIANLRVQMTRQQSETNGKTPMASSKLLAILEKYPDLKASTNYQQLMNALVDAEERIAYSRAFYNRNVRKLNTLITQFPFIIIASMFKIRPMTYLTLVEEKGNN